MTSSGISRTVLPVLILGAAVAGFVVLKATGPSAPAPTTSERIWQVRGIMVEPGQHLPSVELFGRVSSPRTALLRAGTEGEVLSVPASAGSLVGAGTLLLRIDPAEAQLALDQREAELFEAESAMEIEHHRATSDRRSLEREKGLLQIAQRGLDRARDLRTRNLGSDADVDAAQRTLELARVAVDQREQAVADAPARKAQAEARRNRVAAALERARLDRDRTEVRASVDSRIVEVFAAPGERVRLGDPLVKLYPIDNLEIRASLPEGIAPMVRTLLDDGTPLVATGSVDTRALRAQLVHLAGDTRTGEAGISAIFRVAQGAEVLFLNRFVNLRLHLRPEENTIAIPYEALYGRDRVYRVLDGRMQGLRVERLGEQTDPSGRVQALIRHPDLRHGDLLVATRLPNAVDGLRVEVVPDTQTAPR